MTLLDRSRSLRASVADDDAGAAAYHRPLSRRHRAESDVRLNLVSMIDVVFLLFMYFLLTANFTLGEEVYLIDVPQTSAAGLDDPFELPERPLVIRIATIGPGPADCSIRIDLPGLASTPTFDALFRRLDDHRVREGNPTGLFMADNPIHIIPTPATRWEHAIEALNACLRAQYTSVRLLEPGAGE